jgi:hypothetical protein
MGKWAGSRREGYAINALICLPLFIRYLREDYYYLFFILFILPTAAKAKGGRDLHGQDGTYLSRGLHPLRAV